MHTLKAIEPAMHSKEVAVKYADQNPIFSKQMIKLLVVKSRKIGTYFDVFKFYSNEVKVTLRALNLNKTFTRPKLCLITVEATCYPQLRQSSWVPFSVSARSPHPGVDVPVKKIMLNNCADL